MEGPTEVIENDGFEFRASGGAEPVECGGGEGGGVEFAEEGRVGGVCGEEGEEGRVLPARHQVKIRVERR